MVPELEKITGDKNVQVQTVKGTNQVVFKTQTLDLEKREAFESSRRRSAARRCCMHRKNA